MKAVDVATAERLAISSSRAQPRYPRRWVVSWSQARWLCGWFSTTHALSGRQERPGNREKGVLKTVFFLLTRGKIFNLFSANPATDKDYPDLNSVPSCYHHLWQDLSKTKVLSLLPHRSYNCPIDLVPSSTISMGRLYSFSGPERAAMKDYISASLKAGLIRPSSSPAGAGFFFVLKKDGSLRPYIVTLSLF